MTEGGLPAHLESHLGPIHSGRRRMHFAIARFTNEISGGVPYMTLGLSRPRPVIPKTDKFSLYAASPVYLPDEFSEYEHPAGLIVIAWLIPITGAESAYVVEHGAAAFEEHLERTNPNLVDVRRPSSI